MKPTVEQTMQLFRICQQLTNMYLPIYLVRLDERTSNIIMLAGEEIEVYINPQGEVTYE
jgi:hypothetical protein